MKLTASLPMYDFPEVRGALAVLWTEIARRLERAGFEGVPPALVHDRGLHVLWSDPSLLLSQCCGYDLVNRFAGRLRPVATPRYSAPGCSGSDYASVILVADRSRATEIEHLRDLACVVNGLESHSGANALRALVAPLSREGRFFRTVRVSGSHAESIAVLARGEADVTSVDCVTYALLGRHRPASLIGTRPLCYTPRAPGLPYVTRAEAGEERVSRLQASLREAFEAVEVKAACTQLFIEGLDFLAPSEYRRIAEFERLAVEHRYPRLR